MFNGVGLRTTKGAAMSGFIEKNRAFLAVRRQYDFSSSAGGASSSSGGSDVELDPAQAAYAATKKILSARELERSVAALKEHNQRRKIELDTLELRVALKNRGNMSEEEINSQCSDFYAAKLKQYVANLRQEAAGVKRGRDDGGDASGKRRDANQFARAFQVPTSSIAAASTGGDEAPSAFDREAQAAEREIRIAAARDAKRQVVAEAVQKKVMAEAAKLTNANGGGGGVR